MIDVLFSADRFETVQPGITTRHCFSSGAHYVAGNTAFGTLIALDEHAVDPGAGFGWHAHRGVEILSWVLDGTLRHEDAAAGVQLIGTGTGLCQSAGTGISHAEGNASDTDPLHFIQLVLLAGLGARDRRLGAPPFPVGGGDFRVLARTGPVELPSSAHLHLFVARGTARVAGQQLRAGDSARVRDAAVVVEPAGQVLAWQSAAPEAT